MSDENFTLLNLNISEASWLIFICSIIRVGERLHKVLGQTGSKSGLHLFSVVFDSILLILAGNEDMHKISVEFEFRPTRTTDYRVSCLEV